MRLQGKLLLSIVPAIALSLATLGVAVYDKLSAGIADEQLDRMHVAMDRVSATARAYFDMNEVNASLFGDAEPIAHYFRTLAASPERSEQAARSVRSMFRRMKRRVPDFRELRLLTRDGRELIRVADAELVNRSDDESETAWFRQVGVEWGAGIHTNVISHPDDGSLVLTIARPVELADPADERPRPLERLRGYLVITAGLDFLRREAGSQSFGESARILVLDDAGQAVYDSRVGEAASVSFPPVSEWERALALRPPSSGPRLAVDGRWYTVVQGPLFESMTVTAIVPDTAADRLAAGVAKSVAAVTVASIVVAATLFYVVLRVLLIMPIGELRRCATAIEHGENGGLLLSAQRRDEIGELAAAFHRMHRRLADSLQAVQASHDKTERLAFEDPLTGLHNRLWFMRRLEKRIKVPRSGTASGHRFAILLIDLDEFKRFNDRFGFDCGDTVLCRIAERLSSCATAGADDRQALARLGSDEFILSLDDIDSAESMARGIADALAVPMELGGQSHVTQANIGMAVYPDDAATMHDLLRCADLAVCAAKRGPQRFQRYDQSIRDGIEHRRRLEVDLKAAVVAGALMLHYQPQLNVRSGLIQGVESLLRWEHDELGFVPPDVFVAIAEDNGSIVEIGRQVLRDACEQWQRWHREGIAPERVSINVSPRQFQLADVVADVRDELASRKMPAACLEVELTESGVADADDELITALTELRHMGVRVALDDFGKGISTLGALAALPIDTLKIDRSFVTGVDSQSRTQKVLAATLALIESLELEGVAEGVETDAEFRWLQAHGCAIVQGYHFSRPLPEPLITERLRSQRDELRKLAA